MWTEKIYSGGDLSNLENLEDLGFNISNYDSLISEIDSEKGELIKSRIDHIDAMINRLKAEKSMMQDALNGKLPRF